MVDFESELALETVSTVAIFDSLTADFGRYCSSWFVGADCL